MKQRMKYSSGGFVGSQPTIPPEAASVVTDILGAEYVGAVQEICQMYLCMKKEKPALQSNDNLKAVAEAAKTLLNALDRLTSHDAYYILEEASLSPPMVETLKTKLECLTMVRPKKGPKVNIPGRYLVIELADLYSRVHGIKPTRITEYTSSTSATTSTPLDPILKALDPYIHCGPCGHHLKNIL